MNSSVRVRFAPSPTGYLHIGGARTALINWLFARQQGGTFILRIEDTDLERSTQEAVGTILGGLKWLGLGWDEGPFYQTHSLEEHKAVAHKLLESGHAYKSYETKEELDALRKAAEEAKVPFTFRGKQLTPEEEAERAAAGIPYVIRFKVPREEGTVTFTDLVYGEQTKRYVDIEDFVLLRGDGTPLYLLSNVADDIAQRVTHVIRGQDGLSNTPKQTLIYQALGVPVPLFAHLPLILDSKRTKLSKRKHGAAATVGFYEDMGFIPEAFLNFIALLGWSPGDDREILSLEEMRDVFTFDRMSHTNAIFNLAPADPRNFTDPKAIWMNSEYIKTMPIDQLLPRLKPYLEKAGLWRDAFEGDEAPWFANTVNVIRERFRTLNDFTTYGRPYFSDEFEFDPEAVKKNFKDATLKDLFPALADRLEALTEFTHETVEAALRQLAEERDVKAGLLINGSRTALTGQSVGPSMFDVFTTIGQSRVVKRLREAVSQIP